MATYEPCQKHKVPREPPGGLFRPEAETDRKQRPEADTVRDTGSRYRKQIPEDIPEAPN